MSDRVCTGFTGDFDQSFCDQRTGDTGAQQIFTFINRIGPEHREHEIANEFLTQVVDENVFRFDTEFKGFLTGRVEFFALSEIGCEGDHFTLVCVLQPFQDDRGIQTARIGQDNFLNVAHRVSFDCFSLKGIRNLNLEYRSDIANSHFMPFQVKREHVSVENARQGNTLSRNA